jgi:hypothetical protein
VVVVVLVVVLVVVVVGRLLPTPSGPVLARLVGTCGAPVAQAVLQPIRAAFVASVVIYRSFTAKV